MAIYLEKGRKMALHGSKQESKGEQERNFAILFTGIVYKMYFSSVFYCVALHNFVNSQNTGPALYL